MNVEYLIYCRWGYDTITEFVTSRLLSQKGKLQRNCSVLLPGDESNVLFSIIITINLGLTHVGSHHNITMI